MQKLFMVFMFLWYTQVATCAVHNVWHLNASVTVQCIFFLACNVLIETSGNENKLVQCARGFSNGSLSTHHQARRSRIVWDFQNVVTAVQICKQSLQTASASGGRRVLSYSLQMRVSGAANAVIELECFDHIHHYHSTWWAEAYSDDPCDRNPTPLPLISVTNLLSPWMVWMAWLYTCRCYLLASQSKQPLFFAGLFC